MTTTRTAYPALFVLDDSGEATGTVYHFCSEQCRRVFEVDAPVDAETSADWVPGSACDECGVAL